MAPQSVSVSKGSRTSLCLVVEDLPFPFQISFEEAMIPKPPVTQELEQELLCPGRSSPGPLSWSRVFASTSCLGAAEAGSWPADHCRSLWGPGRQESKTGPEPLLQLSISPQEKLET